MSTYYGLLLDLGAVLSWRVPYRRDFYFICFALNIFSVDLNSTSVNSVCSLYFSVDFSHVTMKPKVYLPLCVDKVVLYSILFYSILCSQAIQQQSFSKTAGEGGDVADGSSEGEERDSIEEVEDDKGKLKEDRAGSKRKKTASSKVQVITN